MRKITIVRLGVATALAVMGTVGAIGSGCTSSSSTSGDAGGTTPTGPSGPTADSGGATGDGGGNTGPKDASPDNQAPPAANLVIVHSAPGVPPFRLCFATGTATSAGSVTQIAPLPDTYPSGVPYGFYGQNGDGGGPYPSVAAGTPGLYPGTIGAFPALGISYQNIAITAYAVLASSVANNLNYDGGINGVNILDGGAEEDCVHLIGTHGLGVGPDPASGAINGRLTLGKDFFALPQIPEGTLKDNNTYLLSMNGCLQGGAYDPTAQTAGVTCGPGDAGPWIGVDQIDTTTVVPDGGMGFQFSNRSAPLQYTGLCLNPAEGIGVAQAPSTTCSSGLPNAGYGESPASNGVNADIIIQTADDAGAEAGTTLVVTTVPLSPTAPSLYANTLTPVTIAPIPPAAAQIFGIITATADGGPPAIKGPGTGGYTLFTEWPVSDTIPVPASAVLESSLWTVSTKTSSSPTGQFTNGASYTLVWMGDPAWDGLNPAGAVLADGGLNPVYDGRGMHLVAFPNVFTPFPAAGAN